MLVRRGCRVVEPSLHRPAIVAQLPSLDRFNRIVVKVGSSLLVDGARGAVRREWLEALVSDFAALHERGASVIVVSSGAIALGRTIARLPKRALKLGGQPGFRGDRADRALERMV